MNSLTAAPKLQIADLASADPLAAANKLSAFYRQLEGGYHAGLRAFLQHAYGVVVAFSNDKAKFDKLRRETFWKVSRQKPNAKNIAKWTLYYIMQATRPQVRSRAEKYAKILNFFRMKNTRPCDVARLIDELGGVEKLLCRIDDREPVSPRAVETDVDKIAGGTSHGGSLSYGPGQVNTAHDGRRQGHCPDRRGLPATGQGPGVPPANSLDRSSPSAGIFINTTPEEMWSVLAAGDRIKAPFRATIEVVVHPRPSDGSIRVVSQSINISEDLQPWLLEPDDLQIDDLDLLSDFEESESIKSPVGTGVVPRRPASAPMVFTKKATGPIVQRYARGSSKIVRKIISVRNRPDAPERAPATKGEGGLLVAPLISAELTANLRPSLISKLNKGDTAPGSLRRVTRP